MQIRNCIIITDDDSRIVMKPAEVGDFSGNLVLDRAQIPPTAFNSLKTVMDLSDINAIKELSACSVTR